MVPLPLPLLLLLLSFHFILISSWSPPALHYIAWAWALDQQATGSFLIRQPLCTPPPSLITCSSSSSFPFSSVQSLPVLSFSFSSSIDDWWWWWCSCSKTNSSEMFVCTLLINWTTGLCCWLLLLTTEQWTTVQRRRNDVLKSAHSFTATG